MLVPLKSGRLLGTSGYVNSKETAMDDKSEKRERLQNIAEEMEKRVEMLRKQAITLQEEKESILELLQDVQDGPSSHHLSEGEREDFEYNIERLILRCLTVEVSVITPRNEIQETAFQKVSSIVEDLQRKLRVNPASQKNVVESHLNACLPEPLSSNVNYRFQEKLLDCTAEDQKNFRKQLSKMFHGAQGKVAQVDSLGNGDSDMRGFRNLSDEVVDGEVDGAGSLASDSMDTAACGVGDQHREMIWEASRAIQICLMKLVRTRIKMLLKLHVEKDQGEREDFEYNIERLILRCLTVEVSVITPRNEIQETAFQKVSSIVEDLQRKLRVNPASQKNVVESHLNACLPEPLSSNVNYRFQEKLLDCTAEDQKNFRKQLSKMFHGAQGKVAQVGSLGNGDSDMRGFRNLSDEVVDGEVDGAGSLASDSMDTAACGVGDQHREMVNGKIS